MDASGTMASQKHCVAMDRTASSLLSVQLGRHSFDAAYSSPFVVDFAYPWLYVCEYCLDYTSHYDDWDDHCNGKSPCTVVTPPGRLVYLDEISRGQHPYGRSETLVVYEVNGSLYPYYCQKLSLLGKLFLENKLKTYDVDDLVFYVLCVRGCSGDHIVGYFSKLKEVQTITYNLHKLVIFPPFRRRGYGSFLIGFSYFLSRLDGSPGRPELPLSVAGQEAYRVYCRKAIFAYMRARDPNSPVDLTIEEICSWTGICGDDVSQVFLWLKSFAFDAEQGKYVPRMIAKDYNRFAKLMRDSTPLISVLTDKCVQLPLSQTKKLAG
ncbi:males-absent on the first protein-like isoform X2 [Paramacrobiotus metropolitanus]|uniref:males-absent on the first protein-like isoform X2 n=1 Tax=Paramacrobiotus metropolitanus TaxID=2943436 RepID=UPI002445848F|nr:males-absent on the first protein-like isoform X2 [Paramacrobiotus metropolitanus]